MKLIIDQQSFLEIIARAQSVIEKKSTRPILENVLVTAKENLLVLSATDLRISMTQKCACNAEKAGSISIAGRKLYEIVKEMPAGEMVLEVKDNEWVTITGGKTTFHLPGIPADEFPSIPDSPENFMTIGAEVFERMVARTLFAASGDETRIYLCGVFFKEWKSENGEPCLKMVATDGHRLSLVDSPLSSKLGMFEDGVIVPKKGVSEMKSLISGGGGDELGIASAEGRLFASAGDVTLSITLIDASFPNYQQVVPAMSGEGVIVNCEAFKNALRRVSILSDQETRSVLMEISNSEMKLTSDSPSQGDAKEIIEVRYKGPDLRVAFNANYIMDVLRVMGDEEMRMEIRDSLSPALFVGTNKDASFLSVVMPMRID
jgi:DNA polymerase III subunit beta